MSPIAIPPQMEHKPAFEQSLTIFPSAFHSRLEHTAQSGRLLPSASWLFSTLRFSPLLDSASQSVSTFVKGNKTSLSKSFNKIHRTVHVMVGVFLQVFDQDAAFVYYLESCTHPGISKQKGLQPKLLSYTMQEAILMPTLIYM